MLVLAIDTSSAATTTAIAEVGADAVIVRSSGVRVDARGHGEALAPLIQLCLGEVGASPHELAAIVTGVGPGPFTGLRVGLVTASVMGELLRIPTYAVMSLDAVLAGRSGPVLVAGDARRKEIYWARYVDGIRTEGPDVARPAELVGRGTDDFIAGAGAELYAELLGGELVGDPYPDAESLVAAAAGRIRTNAPSERLVPLYLRRPDAVAPEQYKSVTPA